MSGFDHAWWQRAVIYQIYPRSFFDANGDGVGDLRGISDRLTHCVKLGVDAVWLSPIFPSPMADFGYDVQDYVGIAPVFGTMQDFDQLLARANAAGLKLILDLVPNHTSSDHPWFEASRSNREDPQRDWYLWRDPGPDGGPPNNWLSNFGGAAWTLDPRTHQYYYHSFLPQQPDLNWRNPRVVAAMHEVLRFWLRKGVAGFRIDVIWMLIKDDQWRDNPPNPDYKAGMPLFQSQMPLYTTDRPEVQGIIAGLRRVADEFENRLLIGEIYLPLERLVAYYGSARDGVQLPFNFKLLQCPWDARGIAALIDQYEALLPEGGWPNWVLGNHDKSRIASRVGAAQSRVAAMLLLTLRGTPTLYYGDEIGMHDVPIPEPLIQDPLERRVPGKGLGRDPCRTPMQWDAAANAGFSAVNPWLPVASDFRSVNMSSESGDPRSMFTLYRRLLEARRSHAALSAGSYTAVRTAEPVLAYVRTHLDERVLIVLNLSGTAASLTLPDGLGGVGVRGVGPGGTGLAGVLLLSTHLDREGTVSMLTGIELRPDEGLMVLLENTAPGRA